MVAPLLYQNPATGISAPDSVVAATSKTADYTLVAADSGKRFDNTGAMGAVIFTLPAITTGLLFEFMVLADQNVTILSAEAGSSPNIVAPNTLVAKSVGFVTAGDRVGAWIRVESGAGGAKWHLKKWCPSAMTITT